MEAEEVLESLSYSDNSRSAVAPRRFKKARSKVARLAGELEAEHILTTGQKMPRKELAVAVGAGVEKLKGQIETQSFGDVLEETADKMKEIRLRVLDALLDKDFSMVRAEALSNIAKNLTHDIQLLSGGKTEHVGVEEDRSVVKGFLLAMRGGTVHHEVLEHHADEG